MESVKETNLHLYLQIQLCLQQHLTKEKLNLQFALRTEGLGEKTNLCSWHTNHYV